MPEISRFYGIIVTMYYNDHAPPHFHIRYGAQKAIVAIDSLNVLEGELRSRTLNLVQEWAALHQAELMQNWELARQNAPLDKVDPLE